MEEMEVLLVMYLVLQVPLLEPVEPEVSVELLI